MTQIDTNIVLSLLLIKC